MTLDELTSRLESMPPSTERDRLEALHLRLLDQAAGITITHANFTPRDVFADLPILKGQP